jgi:RecA-family ATPase
VNEGYEDLDRLLDVERRVYEATSRVPAVDDDEAWASESWVGAHQPASGPLVMAMKDVTEQPVTWLWRGRIPEAAVSVLDGHPGTGKSTITLDLAARISVGMRMPDGTPGPPIGNTLILSSEDQLAKPIKARLAAAGADMSRCFGLEGATDHEHPFGRPISIPDDISILHRAILNTEARLVIIDPITAYLSPGIDTGNDMSVRRAITPMARMCAETGATVLLVRHLVKPDRKTPTKPSLFDGGGSVGGFGGARGNLQVTQDEDDPEIKMLHQNKSSYGQWMRPIEYRLESRPGEYVAHVEWMPT